MTAGLFGGGCPGDPETGTRRHRRGFGFLQPRSSPADSFVFGPFGSRGIQSSLPRGGPLGVAGTSRVGARPGKEV